MTLDEILNGVKEVAAVGTQAYSSVVSTQTDKLKEKAAVETPKPAAVPPVANITATSTKTPWYKAAWVIPASIGAVLLLGGFFFMVSRKR